MTKHVEVAGSHLMRLIGVADEDWTECHITETDHGTVVFSYETPERVSNVGIKKPQIGGTAVYTPPAQDFMD